MFCNLLTALSTPLLVRHLVVIRREEFSPPPPLLLLVNNISSIIIKNTLTNICPEKNTLTTLSFHLVFLILVIFLASR